MNERPSRWSLVRVWTAIERSLPNAGTGEVPDWDRRAMRDTLRGAVDGPTHLDEQGRAQMVDVGDKQPSDRRAVARAVVRMSPRTAAAIADGNSPKGDVAAVARIAGIQAAKRAGELIPLAHPLGLSHVGVAIDVDASAGSITIVADARTIAATGVEMEAMTAAAVAALTVYDMVKGMERGVTVERIELVSKTGGKQDWHRSDERLES